MPYLKKTTVIKDKVYVEKVFTARYGDSTIPGPKKKKTSEQVQRQNEKQRRKKVSWLIENNFDPGDWHVTLTFRKEERVTDPEVVKRIKQQLLKDLRKLYRKSGTELRYIIVVEKLKICVHFHVVLNDIPKLGKALIDIWPYGRVYTSCLYESKEGFDQLASYMVKETRAPGEQAYSKSRNVVMPETKVEVIDSKKWTSKPKPKKGYYIQKDSLVDGINPFTGYRQQRYTLIRYDRKT